MRFFIFGIFFILLHSQNTYSQSTNVGNVYWSNFDLKHTPSLNEKKDIEEKFVSYFKYIDTLNKQQADSTLTSLYLSIKNKKMLEYFADLASKYLYDVHSPIYNELYYEPILKVLAYDKILDCSNRERWRMRLDAVSINQVDSKATDFSFWINESKHTLYNKVNKKTVLIFFSVDCEHCIMLLKNVISGKISIKDYAPDYADAQILLVNISEEESTKEYARLKIPSDWIVGFDKEQNIIFNKLYDLRSYPCIYLINSDKIVECKNLQIKIK